MLMSACNDNEYNGVNKGTVSNYSFGLEEKRKNHKMDFEITDDLAIDIGNAVIKSVWGEDVIKETQYRLEYIEDDEAYLFYRVPKDEWTFDGEYDVVINKADGAILWVHTGS